MASNSISSQLNILCLHGYRQNSVSFREKTGAFRKLIKNRAKLVFVDAPNIVPPIQTDTSNSSSESGLDQRGWWFSRPDDYFHAQDFTECDKGFNESVETVVKIFEEQGPFDGVLGFSQGASFLSLLCGLKQTKQDCGLEFDFAIIVAGFKSRSQGHQAYYTEKITCPSLHVYGNTDCVIPKNLSEELTFDCFCEPSILEHPGGHFLPAASAQKKHYIDFLELMTKRKQSKSGT